MATTEELLGRCVGAWCSGATGIDNARRLSGGASQETWSFDIMHPDGAIGAILRRAPEGYGAAPERAAGLAAEAVLMQRAYEAGVPSPRVMHVLTPEDGLGTGFIMDRVAGETIPRSMSASMTSRYFSIGKMWPWRSASYAGEWTKATVEMDCKTWTPTITMK